MLSIQVILLISLSIIPIVTGTTVVNSSVSESEERQIEKIFNLTRYADVIEAKCECDGKGSCDCYIHVAIPLVIEFKADVNFTILPDGKTIKIVLSFNGRTIWDTKVQIGDFKHCVDSGIPWLDPSPCLELRNTRIVHYHLHASVYLSVKVTPARIEIGPWYLGDIDIPLPHEKPQMRVGYRPENETVAGLQ